MYSMDSSARTATEFESCEILLGDCLRISSKKLLIGWLIWVSLESKLHVK